MKESSLRPTPTVPFLSIRAPASGGELVERPKEVWGPTIVSSNPVGVREFPIVPHIPEGSPFSSDLRPHREFSVGKHLSYRRSAELKLGELLEKKRQRDESDIETLKGLVAASEEKKNRFLSYLKNISSGRIEEEPGEKKVKRETDVQQITKSTEASTGTLSTNRKPLGGQDNPSDKIVTFKRSWNGD